MRAETMGGPSTGQTAIPRLRRFAPPLGMTRSSLVTLIVAALGACSKAGPSADSAKGGGIATAAAATPGADDTASGPRPVTVPAEQLGRLHVETVESSGFRPAIQVTGTAQFNADVSTQVLAPISGPVMRIL